MKHYEMSRFDTSPTFKGISGAYLFAAVFLLFGGLLIIFLGSVVFTDSNWFIGLCTIIITGSLYFITKCNAKYGRYGIPLMLGNLRKPTIIHYGNQSIIKVLLARAENHETPRNK